MYTLKYDLTKKEGKFKLLNATNGGPWHKRHAKDQYRSNFADYKAARIPYSRNHDSNCFGIYGGPYAHDITRIFPNFDADPYNPESYDFPCTDEAILVCLDTGTETFFRLGQTIEHQIKKHGTLPPKDFHKWAVICEHIIRHYNEGWADGFHLNIQYWEIWNEPDLDEDDSPNKRTWGGVATEFFDMYEIAAKHLKECFPNLKIGGPALAHRLDWAENFLSEMQKRQVPMDFFSWHIYCKEPAKMMDKADKLDALLQKYGYGDVENILNEWNYIRGWTEDYVYSLKSIHGAKGASFVAACMCSAQSSPIDMLMYYDTRPSVFNGLFDYYTYEKLKGYYPFYWYGMFYDMEAEVKAEISVDKIYSLCGVDAEGKSLTLLSYYSEDDDTPDTALALDFDKAGSYEIYLVDHEHDGELVKTVTTSCEPGNSTVELELSIHSVVLVKEI